MPDFVLIYQPWRSNFNPIYEAREILRPLISHYPTGIAATRIDEIESYPVAGHPFLHVPFDVSCDDDIIVRSMLVLPPSDNFLMVFLSSGTNSADPISYKLIKGTPEHHSWYNVDNRRILKELKAGINHLNINSRDIEKYWYIITGKSGTEPFQEKLRRDTEAQRERDTNGAGGGLEHEDKSNKD